MTMTSYYTYFLYSIRVPIALMKEKKKSQGFQQKCGDNDF